MEAKSIEQIMEDAEQLLINPLSGLVSRKRLRDVINSVLLEAERQMEGLVHGSGRTEELLANNISIINCIAVLRNMRGEQL